MKQLIAILAFSITGLFLLQGQTNLTYAINFEVEDIEGRPHELYEYLDQGHFVLLNFFYTDCNPCIGAVPGLNAAFEKYGCNKGEIIFLAIDFNDDHTSVEQYVSEFGFDLPAISGLDGEGNQVVFDYNISAFPTVVLIAPDRSILAQDIYPVTWPNLDQALDMLAGLDHFESGCYLTGTTNAEQWSKEQLETAFFPNPANAAQTNLEITLVQSGSLQIQLLDPLGTALKIVSFRTSPLANTFCQ